MVIKEPATGSSTDRPLRFTEIKATDSNSAKVIR